MSSVVEPKIFLLAQVPRSRNLEFGSGYGSTEPQFRIRLRLQLWIVLKDTYLENYLFDFSKRIKTVTIY
jgi:hypothetical protein